MTHDEAVAAALKDPRYLMFRDTLITMALEQVQRDAAPGWDPNKPLPTEFPMEPTAPAPKPWSSYHERRNGNGLEQDSNRG